MRIDVTLLRRMWPRAPQALVDAVAERSAAVFTKHGLTTPLRVTHFMAQISHESDGGTITEENMNYTAPRMCQVWPTRFASVAAAEPYAHNPRKLADNVYNGRMGNKPGTDDGYNYRGRGLLQITGRESYREIGGLCGLPLEDRPELAYAPTTSLEVAATEFQKLGCLAFCDQDNINAVTRRVNGGYTGLASRKAWLARWRAALPEEAIAEPEPEPVEPPPSPELPRGSDDILPPTVEHPDKTMTESKTGWAAVVGTVTAIGTAIGQAMDSLRPILSDPRTVAALVVVAAAVGGFIWWDRHRRLKEDKRNA